MLLALRIGSEAPRHFDGEIVSLDSQAGPGGCREAVADPPGFENFWAKQSR